MTEEELRYKVGKLNYKQAIFFGLTCFLRTKHFYVFFEKSNDLLEVDRKLGGEKYLNYLESKLMELLKNHDLESSFFEINLPLFELAIIDDDYFGSSTETFSAQLVAIMAYHILNFGQTKDKEEIQYCVGGVLEIVNQNASDLLYNKFPEKSDAEIETGLERYYTSELSIQNIIIEMIQEEASQEGIMEFSNKNKLFG